MIGVGALPPGDGVVGKVAGIGTAVGGETDLESSPRPAVNCHGVPRIDCTASALYCSPTGRRLIVRINFTPVAVPMKFHLWHRNDQATLHCSKDSVLCSPETLANCPETARTHQTPPMDACIRPHGPGNTLTSSQLWAETVKSTTQRVAPTKEQCHVPSRSPTPFHLLVRCATCENDLCNAGWWLRRCPGSDVRTSVLDARE